MKVYDNQILPDNTSILTEAFQIPTTEASVHISIETSVQLSGGSFLKYELLKYTDPNESPEETIELLEIRHDIPIYIFEGELIVYLLDNIPQDKYFRVKISDGQDLSFTKTTVEIT